MSCAPPFAYRYVVFLLVFGIQLPVIVFFPVFNNVGIPSIDDLDTITNGIDNRQHTVINNGVDIILCVDEKDRFPMYTLINSIIQNEREVERLSFHILVLQNIPLFTQEVTDYFGEYSNQISFEFKSIMDDHPECIEYTERVHRYSRGNKILNTVMNHARFCAPNVFKNVEIGIYLDADMIVQDSISKLYDDYYNTHNYTAWSVMNRAGNHYDSWTDPKQREYLNRYLRKHLSTKYPSVISKLNWGQLHGKILFNAGILMFNWTIWRSLNWTAQSLDLYRFNTIFRRKFHAPPWPGVTQPIINMLFIINHIGIGHLEDRWNLIVKNVMGKINCTSMVRQNESLFLESQSILHFADRCKPWTIQNLNVGYLWTKYIPKKANITQWEQAFNITLQNI